MRFGVVADLHWSVAPERVERWHAPYDFAGLAERCDALVERFVEHGCELLVVAGDVTHDGDHASCDAALTCLLARSPIPLAVVPGNHDVALDPRLAEWRPVSEAWRRAAAIADRELVTLRAVGLDEERGQLPRPHPADGFATVVVSHYPLVAHAERLEAAGLPSPGERADRALLRDRLADDGAPTVVLSGHLHTRDAQVDDNILQITVSALVEPPYEAAVVDVDPLRELVRCTRVASGGAPAEAGEEPWLLAPAEQTWQLAGGRWEPAGESAELLSEAGR